MEIHTTTVLSSFEASALKRRTDVAQTSVSKLGKIFNTTRLPFKSSRDNILKSDLTSLKSGAIDPTTGRLPTVLIGLPFNVILPLFKVFSYKLILFKKHILSVSVQPILIYF